jgi:hypothetical protein
VSPVDIEKQGVDGSESGSPNDPGGSIDVIKQFDTNRAKYAEEVFDCIYVSNKTGGRNAGERSYWASVLFTKFTTTAISLLKLLPENGFVCKCIAAGNRSRTVPGAVEARRKSVGLLPVFAWMLSR